MRVTSSQPPYWDAARRGELALQLCEGCGERPFPPRARCPSCGAPDLAWAPVSGRGTVYSYTVARRAPHPVFAAQLPLLVAIVELDEGRRLAARLVDCDVDTILLKVRQRGGAACHEGYRSWFFRKIDPETRSTRVRIEVPNPVEVTHGGLVRPLPHRAYGEAVLIVAGDPVVLVPRSAVLDTGHAF